ncbi:SDR family NAD(P)-dependent oxidoreductase [Candidatus Woesearchaeota archaeon]|nr:SDR family NAD(P)-dependent oxidoreductase [Candidatus Woesearchaeota archaeon]
MNSKVIAMIKNKIFEGKTVLVTGGAGSIGTELVKQLLAMNPGRLRILDNSESGLFKLQQELGHNENLRYLVGDVRDRDRLRRSLKGVHIVFHAAALKHVPLCEYNPFEALHTNVFGTQNMLDAAREEGVERFVFISTDKAVNPINTMGATKLLGEKLVMNADLGDYKTLFSCVRFGNVLNSVGSVIPIFRRQIEKEGPVTITSEKMTRFFMSMHDAVSLVIKAAEKMQGREIFILKMKSLRITDLAEVMIEELAPKYGHSPDMIKIENIGIRPGEKLYEALITEEEASYVDDNAEMYILRPGITTPEFVKENPKSKISMKSYNSQNIRLLSKEEIKKELETNGII